jgi:hypothetical protein
VIGRLDPSIKQYADSLYEKTLFESGAIVRRESTKYMQERAKTEHHTQLLSDIDYQAQIRIYAEHIERCTAARLDSFSVEINALLRRGGLGVLFRVLAPPCLRFSGRLVFGARL